MAQNNQVKFALEFPQGRMLFLSNAGVYFQPDHSAEAYLVWGERKELFGKNAVSVSKDEMTQTPYSVVYEFGSDGALSDARLVTATQTVPGRLADAATVQALNEALASDKLALRDRRDAEPVRVFNAARFPDGRLLVQLMNKDELYVGKPGAYEKVDARLVAQGGCSMYYRTPAGDSIELPYGFGGPGHDDVPKFKGEELAYLSVEPGASPSKFGLELPAGPVHLNPFSPQLAAPAAKSGPKPAPKPPGL